VRQQVADRPDLQAARTDADEVPRPGLRDRLVEDPGGVVDRFVSRAGGGRELGLQEPADAVVERWLLGPVLIETLPGLGDQLGRVLEHLLARGVQPQGDVVLDHRSDATRLGSGTDASEARRSAPT
jgi:hypothetical protein